MAKFDCYEFVKHYMPSVFDSATDRPIHEREALSTLHYVLSLAYPGDYPAVRELLIQWGLLGRPSMCIRFFNDPRAWEDAGALDCEDDCMCRYNNFFYSMAGHLELEFKEKWIRKLEPHQPALLRNGIMATYGRRFTKPRLRSFFATEVSKFCRDGKCGVVSKAYDDSLLTAVDRANIALIQKIERETH